MDTTAVSVLTRSEIWSSDLKEMVRERLEANSYVNWLTEFPDGSTFTIPSIGDATVRDYAENTAVQYDNLDTGEFQFSINEYKSSGNYITQKARLDAYYAAKLEASFVPKQQRAIAEHLETQIWALAQGGASGGQTVSDVNAINGADHRFVATGTNQIMAPKDFAKALYGLKKAAIPASNLVAFVDPSVEYAMNTLTNLVDVSNNPRWEGIVESGIAGDARFMRNIYGFDVYVNNFLADAGTTGSETVDSVSVTNGKCNVFFSAGEADLLPFMGAWRQMPKVDGEWNKDLQREEYLTTCYYGLKVYRPENLVVVLSDTSRV